MLTQPAPVDMMAAKPMAAKTMAATATPTPAATRLSAFRLLTAGLITAGALSVGATDNQSVQISSLEVKSRIASMEQVNVTAEKTIDENAPAPSAEVSDLLTELERLDTQTRQTPETED